MEKLYIHFGLDNHFLPMEDFIISSKSTAIILDDLNKQIFNGKIKYELVIIPPTDGSFLQAIGIIVTLGATYVVAPIAQDYVLGLYEGISDHKPSYHGKNHGKALRDLAIGFLTKSTEELENKIPKRVNLDRALKAKSDFYKMCMANKEIKALGFNKSSTFPLKRTNFKHHLSKDRIRPLDSEFIIYDAVIVSPVDIDRDSKWELQDKTTNNIIKAHMRDTKFKKKFLNGDYPLKKTKNDDSITVLVEYKKQERNGEIETKEISINTVYSFNGVEIVSLPNEPVKGIKFMNYTRTPMDKLWGENS